MMTNRPKLPEWTGGGCDGGVYFLLMGYACGVGEGAVGHEVVDVHETVKTVRDDTVCTAIDAARYLLLG